MPTPEKIYVKSVRAIPLDEENKTKCGEAGFDYENSFSKPFKVTLEGEGKLEDFLVKIAKTVSASSPVSYNYKKGDNVFFEVTYKTKSSEPNKKFAFLAGKE